MQEPRQQYGLGKLVKKAFKGVKKVFKSPIGKAAILGGLGMWGMGAGPFTPGKFGAGFLKNKGIGAFAKKWLNPFNKANPLLWSGKEGARKLSGKKLFGLGAAGMIAAPFVQKALGYGPYQDEEVEEDDWTVTPGSISNIVSMARAQDPSLNFLPSSAYTQSGFYGADGGIVGLANGGNPGEAQMEQMLRAEYLKYRNKGGTMPYEQFKILIMKQAQQGQMPNQMMAAGGRARYQGGEMVEQGTELIEGPQGSEEFQETVVEGQEQPSREQLEALAMEIFQLPLEELDEQQLLVVYKEAMQGQPMEEAVQEDVQFAANGGRMGFENGELVDDLTTMEFMQDQGIPHSQMVSAPHPDEGWMGLWEKYMEIVPPGIDTLPDFKNWFKNQDFDEDLSQWGIQEEDIEFAANGGRIGLRYGGSDDDDEDVLNQSKAMSMYRTRRQEGGLMDLQGQEKDYRDEGGFVALGGEERADDVPARLSKNEFVFTADAVRNAGGGDIDAGSEVMQNVMDNLEQGGEISEDSQGLQGGEEIMSEEVIDESNPAQGMYDNYEQLQSRVA